MHVEEGSSFLGLVPLSNTVNSKSVVGINPGESGVVMGYQVVNVLIPVQQKDFLFSHRFTLALGQGVDVSPLPS